MKRIALLVAAAALGLSVPASASAQRVRDLVDQVIQAQQQAQNGKNRPPENRGGDRDKREGRGNDGRGGRDDGRYRGPPPGAESWRPGPPQPPVGREISMSQAIRIVEQSAGPGHHLDGDRMERGGRTVYRIQWATDRGERRDYYVDGQTGAIVGGR